MLSKLFHEGKYENNLQNQALRIGSVWRHSDIHQIVLSKKELLYQFHFFDDQSNLLLLLALQQELTDYFQRFMCSI